METRRDADVHSTQNAGNQRLWNEQLRDYRSILILAQDEEKAVAAGNFDYLHHTQSQRARLAERIISRESSIRLPLEEHVERNMADTVVDIITTIQVIQVIDEKNLARLRSERAATAGSMQRHKEARSALAQYKPLRENIPQLFNRTA